MREYEIMFIVRPDLNNGELNSEIEKIKNSILKYKGSIKDFNVWQKRALAYPINRCQEGVYLLGHFELSEEVPQEISRTWKLDTNILRFLILKKGELNG